MAKKSLDAQIMEVATSNGLDDFLDAESLKKGKVYLFGEIDTFLTKRIIQQLHWIQENKISLITLYVNSPGGSVGDSMAIIDELSNFSDYRVVAMGECCSMAAIILALGPKGKRFAYPSTTIMLHHCAYDLPYDDIKKQTTFTSYTGEQWDSVIKMLAKKLGKKEKELNQKIHDTLWLTPEDALKLKIIDDIL